MSKMRVIVVGSGGRVGAAMARIYAREPGMEVIGFNRQALDLACESAIEATLGGLDFDALVNCAAATSVDYCETHREEAFAVNARAVRRIAEICDRKHARCIHLSTDYVFDGTKQEEYGEEDMAAPINSYGGSKRQGEEELLAVSGEHLAVRVSWVFGPDRPGFVEQTLRRAMQGNGPAAAVAAVADKWSIPTSVFDIVHHLRPFLRDIREGGLLHLTQTGGACTWQEYGQFALDCAARAGAPLKVREVARQTLAEMTGFIAERPVHTAMATHRLKALTGESPRSWQEALEEYVRQFWRPICIA